MLYIPLDTKKARNKQATQDEFNGSMVAVHSHAVWVLVWAAGPVSASVCPLVLEIWGEDMELGMPGGGGGRVSQFDLSSIPGNINGT